jgi:hypothetical protein
LIEIAWNQNRRLNSALSNITLKRLSIQDILPAIDSSLLFFLSSRLTEKIMIV